MARPKRWKLPSGRIYVSSKRPDRAVEADPAPPAGAVEDLPAVVDQAVTDTAVALAAGDTDTADRVLRHAVHLGAAPSALAAGIAGLARLGVGDEPVQVGDGGPPVGSDVQVQLPAETPQLGDTESGGPATGGEDGDGDDQTRGQDAKRTGRRKTAAKRGDGD